jgi:hypothetical protein
MGVLTVNTLNWCTLRNSAVSGGRRGHGAHLPAGDVVGLAEAGHDEGARRQAWVARGALVRLAVEHHVLVHLVADQQHVGGRQQLGQRCMSAALQTVALGLCGLLTMMARARREAAAMRLSKSGRKLPGVSGTRTTRAAGQLDVGHVAVVAGLEHDDLVARATRPGWR